MAYDDQNVFAKILRGEMPAHTVYEDEATLAFLDVMPQAPGHTLVIPRAPAENLFDVDPDALSATIRTTQKVAEAVRRAFEAPGIMLAQLNGPAAGQTVFHIHFHVIPRHEGVDLGLHAREPVDQDTLAAHAERIRAVLAG